MRRKIIFLGLHYAEKNFFDDVDWLQAFFPQAPGGWGWARLDTHSFKVGGGGLKFFKKSFLKIFSLNFLASGRTQRSCGLGSAGSTHPLPIPPLRENGGGG